LLRHRQIFFYTLAPLIVHKLKVLIVCSNVISSIDLRQTWKKIKIAVKQQVRELAIKDEQSRITNLTSIMSKSLYHPILRKVTCCGFIFMESQRCLDNADQACTRIFTRTMGLLRRHTLQRLEATDQSVQLADIHRHWYIDHAPMGVNGIP